MQKTPRSNQCRVSRAEDHLAGTGEEIAPDQDQHHPCRRQDEEQRMEEPGDRCDRVIKRPQSAVGMFRRKTNQPRRTARVRHDLLLRDIRRRHRSGSDHDRRIVRKPEPPRELEEGIDENAHDEQEFHFPHQRGGRRDVGKPLQHGLHLLSRADAGRETADGDGAGGGEKRIALTET